MHNNPQMYNPMAYPMEGMIPNNQGYVMNYQDPNQIPQGYMDPRDQMPRDYNQGYPMKKVYPRNPNYGYPQKGYRGGMKPMQRRDPRSEGYPKYNDRKFRPNTGYYGEELGAEENFGQSKLLPQSKKISKPFPRNQDRRFDNQRFPQYEDQHYMMQDYGHPSKMHRKQHFDPAGPDHKGLNPTMFFKTKMCPHLQEDQCTRGPGCNYAHSQSELREAPNLKKTRLCQLFMSGKCTRGQLCSFAHGEEELRATPEFFKTSLCTGYLRGACRAGDNCRYAHGDEELRLSNPIDDLPKFPHQQQQQQPSEMSMYRPQYNMSDYELSAYQSMDPTGLEMQQHDYRGPMGNPMPYHYAGQIDPRNQQYENNMNPNETGSDQETEPLTHNKNENAPETAPLSNKFDDYMYNNNERPVPIGEAVPKQQAENPVNVPYNTNNPEKLNSLSTNQNPNPNGNF